MESLVSVAVQSIIQEPIKHATNVTAGSAGVIAAPDWLGIAIGVVSLITACAILYKTYLEIRLKKIQLAKVDRRQEQKKPNQP
jgi:hypothetical protein